MREVALRLLPSVITHDWSTPSNITTKRIAIGKPKAERIYRIINRSEELTNEERSFTGYFLSASFKNGDWRIFNTIDGHEYGRKSSPEKLEGVTLRKVNYNLVCQEVIEENTVEEKDAIKLLLQSVIEV